jgi:hypothetical protein
MTLEEFRRLAAAWGGDVERWPAAARADAARLVERSAEAAALVADAGRLDSVLVAARPSIADERTERLIGRVATAVAAASAQAPRPGLLRRWLMPATSFASAALVGIGLGFGLPIAPAVSGAELVTTVVIEGGFVSAAWVLP